MRTKFNLRALSPAYLAGALAIAVPAAALAFTQSQSLAQTTPQVSATRLATRLAVPKRHLNVMSGQPVVLRGSLEPGVQGRTVQLERQSGQRWRTVASAQTAAAGRFVLRYQPAQLGSEQLLVRFGGDAANAPVNGRPGLLTVYRQTMASWYDDGGSTACGFHVTLGVASPTLPCGTHVRFLHGGHRVTAVVDDRGPFVAGRDWDLNQATAAALGFGGVGSIWSSA